MAEGLGSEKVGLALKKAGLGDWVWAGWWVFQWVEAGRRGFKTGPACETQGNEVIWKRGRSDSLRCYWRAFEWRYDGSRISRQA